MREGLDALAIEARGNTDRVPACRGESRSRGVEESSVERLPLAAGEGAEGEAADVARVCGRGGGGVALAVAAGDEGVVDVVEGDVVGEGLGCSLWVVEL
jgi:hypothetical protein